jgi:PPOX class probable FMN-dependent enzyme
MAFMALSPFVVVASSDRDGRRDAYPRGDRPGLVANVFDDYTLLLPDRTGNRWTDTMLNITANPHVGLLFMVPGLSESLRVNGSAKISIEPTLQELLAVEGKPPMAAMVVNTEEVFFHCGKPLLRSDLWNPQRKISRDRFPLLAKILADQARGTKWKTWSDT